MERGSEACASDYYDYSLADDGTLTVTLGDATGHGMDAGVVVNGTKSLFQTFADAPSITDSLTVMSKSLKRMDLPQICERMLQGGEEWAQGRPQDDDITLVVLKAK